MKLCNFLWLVGITASSLTDLVLAKDYVVRYYNCFTLFNVRLIVLFVLTRCYIPMLLALE